MNNSIVRLIIRAVIVSLISAIVVSIIGVILGWKTFIHFSDGYFWAGIIAFAMGFVNIMGMYNQDDDPRLLHSQTSVQVGKEERFNLWQSDISRSHTMLALLGASGLLLIGLSGLSPLLGKMF